jgi:hypothetical protein
MKLLFTNITAILPERLVEDAWVLCEKGKIVSISTRKPKVTTETQIVDGRGGYLSPGFIDIHVHGGNGADFMDGTSEAVRVACRAHARHGTTTIFQPPPPARRSRFTRCWTQRRLCRPSEASKTVHESRACIFTGRSSRRTRWAAIRWRVGESRRRRSIATTLKKASCASPPVRRSCRERSSFIARRRSGAA